MSPLQLLQAPGSAGRALLLARASPWVVVAMREDRPAVWPWAPQAVVNFCCRWAEAGPVACPGIRGNRREDSPRGTGRWPQTATAHKGSRKSVPARVYAFWHCVQSRCLKLPASIHPVTHPSGHHKTRVIMYQRIYRAWVQVILRSGINQDLRRFAGRCRGLKSCIIAAHLRVSIELAKVAELVDALDLGSCGATRESSSLSFRTKLKPPGEPRAQITGAPA